MQELTFADLIPLAVVVVALLAIKILRADPRAFGLPKDALWTPESEAERWKAHAPTHIGIDLASGPDYSVETTIDRLGNVVSWKPAHGDPLPEEEESDMERERR